jgi:uncharacterized membrane protein YraQ (UPF0718 family)
MLLTQPDWTIPFELFGRHFTFNLDEFLRIFTSILYEAMPFIVLGALIAGLLEELLPQQLLTRFLPKSKTVAILIGGFLGIIFPMCECGIIPVMRRLIRKGLPLSCCIAYLLAGPIINVIVMLSTYFAFSGMENLREQGGAFSYQMGGIMMMVMRVSLGYLVAVVTALIVERQYQKYGNELLTPIAQPAPARADEVAVPPEQKTLGKRLSNISETSLHDFIDITVFLIIGALLASTVRQLVTTDEIAAVGRGFPYLAIILMMALAIVLCLCSEADAFLAASFTTLRPSAKLAFLVLGPMLDIKLLFMYTRVFRPRLIRTIAFAVLIQVFIYCTITHVLWEKFAPEFITPPAAQTNPPQ